jgi:hypothetical protein
LNRSGARFVARGRLLRARRALERRARDAGRAHAFISRAA